MISIREKHRTLRIMKGYTDNTSLLITSDLELNVYDPVIDLLAEYKEQERIGIICIKLGL